MRTIAAGVGFACVVSAALMAQSQATVYEPGPGITLPSVIKEVKPDYPREAMDSGAQGSVIMRCVVGTNGKAGDIQVTKALEPRLDETAVAALKQWEFKPGTKDGEPVPVRVSIEMRFTLK